MRTISESAQRPDQTYPLQAYIFSAVALHTKIRRLSMFRTSIASEKHAAKAQAPTKAHRLG